MQQFQYAVATRCWRMSVREALKQAAGAGVTGVQFDLREELPPTSLGETARRDFLHLVRELGLRTASTMVPFRHPLYVEHELDHRVAALTAAMKFAYQLGSPTVCFRCGPIPKAESRERQLLTEVLSDLAASANHVGVLLAITPTGDDAQTLLEFLSTIKTGPIGVDFDPAHFAMSGQKTSDCLRLLHALVFHVQLRDGVREMTGQSAETAVGQGAVDWIELLALLNEMDYRGWLTAIRTQGDDKSGDAIRAIKHVRRLLLGG